MSHDAVPDDQPDDPATASSTTTNILVARALLEQVYAQLTEVYQKYRSRKLRQAIMMIEHLLGIRH